MNSKERHEARYQRRKEKRINKKKEYLKEYSFEKICSFDSLRKAFYKCRKGCNWKASVERYGRNVLRNSLKYSQMLLRGEIVTRGFVEFDQVERGKLRHIMSVHISERVCQKSLNDNALVPLTEKTLIYENGASQKGKGTEFAARGFKRDLHRYWMRYGNKGYVICGDAHDFFGSLQHNIVEKNVRRFILDERIIKMMMGYINPFPRGLGLGSQTCQIDAVGYPDPVDHKIKGSCKYYQRYMDDWIIIVREKSDAVKLLDMITKIQMTAATAAETMHTAAQGKGIIATKAATIAQALFNAVAKANPYVLLATALITVVGALAAFAIGNSAAKEKQKEMNDEIQRGTENLKDLDFQYQRRIERFKAEGATQKAILTQQMNDAKSQVINVQRQYNDYLDKLAHDGVEKYSDEQQKQIDTYESSLKERKQAYIKAADAVSNYTIQSNTHIAKTKVRIQTEEARSKTIARVSPQQ